MFPSVFFLLSAAKPASYSWQELYSSTFWLDTWLQPTRTGTAALQQPQSAQLTHCLSLRSSQQLAQENIADHSNGQSLSSGKAFSPALLQPTMKSMVSHLWLAQQTTKEIPGKGEGSKLLLWVCAFKTSIRCCCCFLSRYGQGDYKEIGTSFLKHG